MLFAYLCISFNCRTCFFLQTFDLLNWNALNCNWQYLLREIIDLNRRLIERINLSPFCVFVHDSNDISMRCNASSLRLWRAIPRFAFSLWLLDNWGSERQKKNKQRNRKWKRFAAQSIMSVHKCNYSMCAVCSRLTISAQVPIHFFYFCFRFIDFFSFSTAQLHTYESSNDVHVAVAHSHCIWSI